MDKTITIDGQEGEKIMTDDQIERVAAVVKAELDGFTTDCGKYSTFANIFKPALARYIAHAAIEAMQGWRPIADGAPKDGTPILVTYNFEDYTVVSWNKYCDQWNLTEPGLNAEDGEFYPTHFMLFPTPPTKG